MRPSLSAQAGRAVAPAMVRTARRTALASAAPASCGTTAYPQAGPQPTLAILEALDHYDILDTPSEEGFERVTRLVRQIFDVPMSTVTFLDGHRQWFKARQGIDERELAGDTAFCRIPIAENKMLVVPDTLEDDRFKNNPFVIGPPHLRFYAGAPLRGANGLAIGTLCAMDLSPRKFTPKQIDLFLDLGRIVETELELRVLATTDALTGVVARRAFLAEGERAIKLAVRHGYDLSCICIDLDHFKAINDSVGHAGGDAVLKATTQTCEALLRKSDIFGRLGGEEFAILLPHAGAVEAGKIAEKLRAAIEAQAEKSERPLAAATASFGVATLSSASDLSTLIASADEALYRAKSRGRNCCVAAIRRRDAVGRKVLKAGSIAFNFGATVIDCTVRRLSDTGATIGVLVPDEVPDTFKLSIESEGFSRACEVVRKQDHHVEVAFA